jgi:hypothetical protein
MGADPTGDSAKPPVVTCRFCPKPAVPALRRHNGFICADCLRKQEDAYNRSEAGRARERRYRLSAKGRASHEAANKRRLLVGHQFVGQANSVEQAALINAHIKRRRREFIARLSAGAQVEGAPTSAVPPEADV